MNIQHKLGKCAVQARYGALHDDETRARELGGGLEVEARFDARDVEMFAWCEGESAGGAPAVDLDIGGLVRAIGDIGGRQVGDGGEHVMQGRIAGLGLILKCCDFAFFLFDFSLQKGSFIKLFLSNHSSNL